MKKIVLLFSFLLIISFVLFACTDDGINLDEIDIEAIDRVNVPVGTYTIQYYIEDISNLVKNHGAVVSFEVKNSQNQVITVTGNTFTIALGEVYTVKIKLTVGESSKEKTITVTAVTVMPPVLVSFELNGGTGSFPAQTLPFGSYLELIGEPIKDGYTFEGWYYEEVFTTLYLSQIITSNITLYAKWEPVVIETVTVRFELQGGSGTFGNQTVQMGSYAVRPTTEPTRQGYQFLGWYVGQTGGQPFDFETMAIYNNTVIYAQWQELNTNTYTVTYSLNGAFQPEPITEEVTTGESPVGPTTEFIYEGHIFQGWSTDDKSEVALDLSELDIIDDLTLYAVWHIDFDVIDGSTYMQDYQAINKSTLNDGFVEQIYSISTYMHLSEIEDDLSIDEDRVDYGILYSHDVEVPTYYDTNSTRLERPFSEFDSLISIPLLEVFTEPLLSDTTYYIVTFVRFEQTIIYSDVFTLKTYIQVPEGQAVGALYVLSGGYYKYDSNTTAFHPSTFIEILDGYEAKLDDVNYTSFSQIKREGIRRLVTKEISSGKEYLHVFHLDFQTPHVILTWNEHQDSGTSFNIQYGIVLPFVEDINYPISELGVLYSTEHPFLKIGIPDVEKRLAILDQSDSFFVTNTKINVSNETVYVRGYAIINGKVSYSQHITKLTYNTSTNIYEATETIDTTTLKTSPEFGTSANYTPSTMRVYKVVGDDITYVDYPNSYELNQEGQYFVRNSNGTGMIDDILIIDDFPEVTGINDQGQYVGSILISYDMYNPYWYYSLNGGDFIDLPASIRLTVPGSYQVYYRTGEGMEVINFEIVAQATE